MSDSVENLPQTAEVLEPVVKPNSGGALQALTPMDMIVRALDNDASAEALEKLMALQERWEANQARKAFDKALAKAKAEIPVIPKNKLVDFPNKNSSGRTTYSYEDLAGIAEIINPHLSKNGLSYRFRTTVEPNGQVCVTCILSHEDGHTEENSLLGPRDTSGNKNSIQSMGSAVTYLQRYTLKAALGLAASKDDDAQSVSDPANRQLEPASNKPQEDNAWSKDENSRTYFWMCEKAIASMKTIYALQEWGGVNADSIKKLPNDWYVDIKSQYEAKLEELKGGVSDAEPNPDNWT